MQEWLPAEKRGTGQKHLLSSAPWPVAILFHVWATAIWFMHKKEGGGMLMPQTQFSSCPDINHLETAATPAGYAKPVYVLCAVNNS